MESVFHIVADDCVLLLNGSFVQSATSVRYEYNEPLYVTVLPLNAVHLPYTVEFLRGKAVTNKDLAICCDMGDGHLYIELKPRYAFVYTPNMRYNEPHENLPSRLLGYVRGNNFAAARTMLTDTLGESVTNEALSEFFEGVTCVRENTFTPQKGYLLIKEDGTASRCDIVIKGGLIENIII